MQTNELLITALHLRGDTSDGDLFQEAGVSRVKRWHMTVKTQPGEALCVILTEISRKYQL